MSYDVTKQIKLGQLQDLALRTKAAIDALDAAVVKSVTLTKESTATTGYAATYTLAVNGTDLQTKIDIPKDFLVKAATLEVVDTADTPYQGAVPGDKYIDFVINAKDASATAEHIYLPVNDLVDVYVAGNGLELNSSTNTFSVKVDSNNANGLSTSANGLALALATDSAAGAMGSTEHTKLTGISAEANKTTVTTQGNGAIEIDGTSKTVVYIATDAEVDEMLDEIFGEDDENAGD